MTPDALLALFRDTSTAIRDAVATVQGERRRARTDRPGQYAIDLVADAAALEVLHAAPVAVVSEESGVSGAAGAGITVVLDPVDGSSNASRHLPYWATSLCALDGTGPLAALVVNQATGSVSTATHGGGAFRDGERLHASDVVRVEDAFVALSTFPGRMLAWKQFRALGSCALALCDTAAGIFDGYFDGGSVHAPWDYLGGLLVCEEAGATVVDAGGRPLVTADPNARRHLVAAGTPPLLDALRSAAG
jgi:fructose-1,6-bisphosphatase/inositol monophosphatase family enzyme